MIVPGGKTLKGAELWRGGGGGGPGYAGGAGLPIIRTVNP